MLLTYANPILAPIINEKKESAGQWFRLIARTLSRLFFDIVGELVADTLTAFVPALLPVNRLIKTGITFVTTVVDNLIWDKKVDWVDVITSSAWNVLAFGSAKLKSLVSKTKYGSKAVKLTKSVKKSLDFFKKGATEKIIEGAKFILEKTHKYRVFNSARLRKIITPQNFSKTINTAKFIFSAIKNPTVLFFRGLSYGQRKLKSRLQERLAQIQLEHFKKQLKKEVVNAKIKSKTVKKYLSLQRRADRRIINLAHKSAWIWGVKMDHEELTDQTQLASFMLYFQNEATSANNTLPPKRPLHLSMLWSDFFNFIEAPSCGSYYLENIAWGKPWQKSDFDDLEISETQWLERKNYYIKRLRLELNKDDTPADHDYYAKEIKKHRTNKRQLFAHVYKTQSGRVIKFSDHNQNRGALYSTITAKKAKPKRKGA